MMVSYQPRASRPSPLPHKRRRALPTNTAPPSPSASITLRLPSRTAVGSAAFSIDSNPLGRRLSYLGEYK